MEAPIGRTRDDFAIAVTRATIASIPIVGGGAVEFFNLVVGDPAQKRRDEFYERLLERLQNLEGTISAITPENLANDEQFQATFIECAQISARTTQEQKRELLRNAIINTAVATNLNETVRAMFVQLTDRLTVDHIRLLKIYDDPSSIPAVKRRLSSVMMGPTSVVIEAAAPDLAADLGFCELLLKDLHSAALMEDPGLHTTMTGDGIGQPRTTKLGRNYLLFLSDPETRKMPDGIEP